MNEQTFGSPKKGLVFRLAGSLLALSLLIYLLSQQGWADILVAVRQISPWKASLALGLMAVSRLLVTGRWHVLLRFAGLKVSYWQSLRLTMAGLFATNFLPTTIGGDVVRLAGAIQLHFDGAICAASLVVDRLVGMVGMALLLPFGLPFLFAPRAPVKSNPLSTMDVATAHTFSWVGNVMGKIKGFSRRLVEAMTLWLKRPLSLVYSLIFTLGHMACLFTMFSLLFGEMGDDYSFWLIGDMYSIAYFVTLAPISINGYGVQEISLTFVFSSLAGAPVSHSLTVALLYRTMTMLASLPGALYVPGILTDLSPPKTGNIV